jgi:hypothetical protein
MTECTKEYVAASRTADGFLVEVCRPSTCDLACLTACENAYPAAQAADEALYTCTLAKCPGPCSSDAGPPAAAGDAQ